MLVCILTIKKIPMVGYPVSLLSLKNAWIDLRGNQLHKIFDEMIPNGTLEVMTFVVCRYSLLIILPRIVGML